MGEIGDGAAPARAAAPKRRRDTGYVYPQPQLAVRGDGGRDNITGTAALARGGGTGGIDDGAAVTRGAAPKRRRDTGYVYVQSSGDGGAGNIMDIAALARRGGVAGIVDGAALARGAAPKRQMDTNYVYPQPQLTVRGDGGRDNLPGDTAALARGGGSRDGDKQPSVCGGMTGNTAEPDLVRSALKTLPKPPKRLISLEEEDVDHDDPLYWTLYWRGIEPDNRYRHYVDLYLQHQPQLTVWNEVWRSLPLELHDAGLVEAVNSVIQWGPGMEEGILDLSSTITCILTNHPGPISCLRIDSTELPGPERMKNWMSILTSKLAQQLILVNIELPMDLELPLHHLRSPKLKRLCVGFASIRNCLRFAFGADRKKAHCWASLTELNLICCGFTSSDFSDTVRALFGLKMLTIGRSNLTVGCEREGLILASTSLVSIHLWDCTAETAVTVGRAPALKYLTVGVKAVNSPSLLLQIDACEDLCSLDRVALHQQEFRLCTAFQTKMQRKNSISLRYLRTLTMASQFARADNTRHLLSLLKCFPNLMNLTVWRVDSDNGDDEEFPSLYSVACLRNKLEQFILKDFRGGRGEVTFLLYVLGFARKLKSLMVHSHATMPRTPKEAAEFFRSAPRRSQNCAIVVFAPVVE